MAEDFSFLTDSEDERAVEDLLSQALDHSTLEQVSAINCSSFSDSPLPSHLESRFRKLKSFPISCSNSNSIPPNKAFHETKSLKQPSNPTIPESVSSVDDDDSSIFKPSNRDPLDKTCLKLKTNDGSFQSASNSSKLSDYDDDSSTDSAIFTPSKRETGSKSKSVHGSSKLYDDYPYVKTGSKSKSGHGSKSFRSNSSNGMVFDDSPPRNIGCLWCSPKKGSSRKQQSGENRFDWGKDEDLLSDLGSFSIKEQERILKKALKEEEKINREAAKIVKWAKQASARMDVAGLDADELCDNDNDNANAKGSDAHLRV